MSFVRGLLVLEGWKMPSNQIKSEQVTNRLIFIIHPRGTQKGHDNLEEGLVTLVNVSLHSTRMAPQIRH